MLICLFRSLKSIFISVALVSAVSGNIRVGPTERQGTAGFAVLPCLVQYYLCCLPTIATKWRNPVPLTPPRETSAQSPFFSCAETCARIQNSSLLSCLLVWVGCRGRTGVGVLDCFSSYRQHVWTTLSAVCVGAIVIR